MPAPKNPRIPIPRFSKTEIDTADLCATALFYGIDFETGKSQTSDAYFLETFATQFYKYDQTGTFLRPPIMVLELRELIKTARVYILYRGIAGMDFAKGIRTIKTELHPIYKSVIKPSYRGTPDIDAALCLKSLSDGLVKNNGDNRLVLASRLLFFLIPDLQVFNMNNAMATHFGLPTRPHYHYSQFFSLMSKGLKTNQTRLNPLKLPNDIFGELSQTTWERVRRTDWWHRRVIDLAILIHCGFATPYPNLRTLLDEKIKSQTRNSLAQ